MNPVESGSVEGEDRDKFMEELEAARIASSLESRRQQALIRRAEWVPEARKEVAAREEFKKTMEIFPDLVWEAILERVCDSKDKTLMTNMTEMWWKLCKGDRVKFLFQGVFGILHANGYLSTNDMLDCRLICKEWKRSIDNHLQSSDSTSDIDLLPPKPLPMLELIFRNYLQLPERDVPIGIGGEHSALQNGLPLANFLQSAQHEYSGDNPFISRKLIVEMPAPIHVIFNRNNDDDNYYRDNESYFSGSHARDILEWFGRELWELSIFFYRGMSAKMLLTEIIDKLVLCPNLRYLRIISNEYGELDRRSDVGMQRSKRRQSGNYIYGRLLHFLEATPLPDLPYLKSLQTTFVPAPIIQAMIKKYGSTLETICGGAYEARPTDYVEGCIVPELKEFKSFYFAPDNEETPLIFQTDWHNLKELTLLFENVRKENILGLFGSLNRFSSEGLRKLTLHLHKEDGTVTKLSKSMIKQLSLELPQLEVMTLSVCRINLSSIDFLLPLVKLKELNLIYVKYLSSFEAKTGEGSGNKKAPPSKTDRDELIQLSDYTNRLYESNIWRVFPELKVVRIGVVKICTANKLLFPGKRKGGKSTEQLRLIQVRIVSEITYDVEGIIQNKKKVYTREGYELHMKTSK